MLITDAKIHKLADSGSLKALISLTFDNLLVITGFQVKLGKNGLFASMPQRRLDKPDKNNKLYLDTSFPLNADFRRYICDYLLKAYHDGSAPEYVSTAGLSEMANNRSEKEEDPSSRLPF